jgi:hypothetical protein
MSTLHTSHSRAVVRRGLAAGGWSARAAGLAASRGMPLPRPNGGIAAI